MDPNANIEEQNRILARVQTARTMRQIGQDGSRRTGLRKALRNWLENGGFEPDWSKCAVDRKYYI